ncbi:MAG TPA: FHA domain-containing protein, partial [Pyrinomonadaceae bacterium]
MREIILYIEAPDGTRQRVALENEITIGRTRLAQIAIDDAQLSRVHTTVWREGDDVWIQDENSTNGTFVNGERIAGERKLNEGDEILLGGETRISVEIFNSAQREMRNAESKTNSAVPPIGKAQTNIPQPATGNPQSKKIPTVPLVAGLGIFAIVFFTLIALLLANSLGGSGSGNYGSSNNGNPTPVTAIRSGVLIPVRVVDPLGGEDPEELDDLIALFEVEEKELKAEDLSEVKSTAADDATKPSE